MGPIKFLDPLGWLDMLSGLFLFFTVTVVPTEVAHLHAGFLIFKGLGTMIRELHLPVPVYYLGGGADLMSSAMLLFGKPPILQEYKIFIVGFLFLKGVWTSLSLMR